jgi:hypothetical protein
MLTWEGSQTQGGEQIVKKFTVSLTPGQEWLRRDADLVPWF